MEFKGTKGEWKIIQNHPNKQIIDIEMNSISESDWGNLTLFNAKDCETQMANAILISKAPEMLEFIQHVYNSMPNGSSLQKKAERLIKEATEL